MIFIKLYSINAIIVQLLKLPYCSRAMIGNHFAHIYSFNAHVNQ